MQLSEVQRRCHGLNFSGSIMEEQKGRFDDKSRICRSTASKRQKSEGNSIKDKKDKLGERVVALQQLVSPFGKTDTASVLSEATAYIKFLHDQVEVLSAPYLQSVPLVKTEDYQRYSLRSRGLCLVPLECTGGIASSNGADIWAPINANNIQKQ
ncbi:hypothetical protein QJS10_CPB04g01882 [Acorus calamus]|uniref:BHLH domain-containing protein n=1 Tax=Acorus calamus TaxID=4465 RepID=A0AAV9EYI4_ACOCL|nr:hypothetical protein QJS10_CPB04g01882 [Acorus calamus]